MSTLELVKWLDFFMNLAVRLGVDERAFVQMRAESGGHLTPTQVKQLADEADETIARM